MPTGARGVTAKQTDMVARPGPGLVRRPRSAPRPPGGRSRLPGVSSFRQRLVATSKVYRCPETSSGCGPRPRGPCRAPLAGRLDRYAVDLGAVWNSGGPGPGFAPGQLRFANGARIELLMPYDPHINDFLQRFLAASGPGPHHLTFKVPDLLPGHRPGPGGRLRAHRDRSPRSRVDGGLPPPQGRHRRRGPDGRGPECVDQSRSRRLPERDGGNDGRIRSRSPASLPAGRACRRRPGRGRRPSSSVCSAPTSSVEGARSDHRWMELDWGGPLALRLVAPVGHSSPRCATGWAVGAVGSTTSSSTSMSPRRSPTRYPGTGHSSDWTSTPPCRTQLGHRPGRQCRTPPGHRRRVIDDHASTRRPTIHRPDATGSSRRDGSHGADRSGSRIEHPDGPDSLGPGVHPTRGWRPDGEDAATRRSSRPSRPTLSDRVRSGRPATRRIRPGPTLHQAGRRAAGRP